MCVKRSAGQAPWQAGFNHSGGCLGCRAAEFLSCLMLLPWDALRQKQLIAKGHKRQRRSFRRATITPLCVREKKYMTALRIKELHQYFPTERTLQLCQLGSRWLALRQGSRTHSEGVACVKMWVVKSHHTSFYRFPRIAGKKWLSHGSPVCRATRPWLPSK